MKTHFAFLVVLFFDAIFLALIILAFAAAVFFEGAFFLAGAFFAVLTLAALACVFSASSTALVNLSTFFPVS